MMQMPSIDYFALLPVLLIFGFGVVGTLIEAFVAPRYRRVTQIWLSFAALGSALAATIGVAVNGRLGITAGGTVSIDGPTLFLWGAILVAAFLASLLAAERHVDPSGDAFVGRASTLPGGEEERKVTTLGLLQTEIWPLMLFSITGMMLFVSASNMLMLFVALEVMSLPLYLLVGLARRRRLLSQEASLKYFILGSLASALLLFGIALLFAYSGSLDFAEISISITTQLQTNGLLLVSVVLIAVGMLFKVGAVPFQQWIPDVYQGAPTPITALMAGAVKIAAFGALLRVFYVALGGLRWEWRPIIWLVAILTMVVGSLLALTQNDVKRMLAYSAVANTGFLLVGFAGTDQASVSSMLFYLATYAVATVAAFGLLSLVRGPGGEAAEISAWAGLGRKEPLLAVAFGVLLLTFAGVPFTSGFVAKFAVFTAGAEGGALLLVLIGALASVIAAVFYIRLIVVMFFTEPPRQAPVVAIPSAFTAVAIAIGAAASVLLGVIPQPMLELAQQASVFIR